MRRQKLRGEANLRLAAGAEQRAVGALSLPLGEGGTERRSPLRAGGGLNCYAEHRVRLSANLGSPV